MAKKKVRIKAKKASSGKRRKSSRKATDADVYSAEGREALIAGDEISAEEEGFMLGYEKGERLAKCARCEKAIRDRFVEKEISGEMYHFCSKRCAEHFEPAVE